MLTDIKVLFLLIVHRFVLLRRARTAKWASKNKAHLRCTAHERWYRNHEANLAKSRQSHIKNKHHRSIANREWREKHADHRKEYMKRWWANNLHKRKAYDVRRRAIRRQRELLADVRDTKADLLVSIWKKQSQFTCVYCGNTYPASQLHVDHIRPLSKGGKHTVRNLAKSCQSCNAKKRDRILPVDCWMFPGLYETMFSKDQSLV